MLEIPGTFAGQVRSSMAQSGFLSTLPEIKELSLSDVLLSKTNDIMRILQAPLPVCSEMQLRSDFDQAQPTMYKSGVPSQYSSENSLQPPTPASGIPKNDQNKNDGEEEGQVRVMSTYDVSEPSIYCPSVADSRAATRVNPAPNASPLVAGPVAVPASDSPPGKAKAATNKVRSADSLQFVEIDTSSMTESALAVLFEDAKSSFNSGNLDDSFSKHTACLRGRRGKLGEKHFDTLESMYELARVQNERGCFEEALSLLKERMQVSYREDIESNRLAATFLLGDVCNKLGKYDLAITTLKKDCLGKQEKRLGAEHPNVLLTKFVLADAYNNNGDFSRAEEYFRACLRGREKTLGEKHENVLSTKRRLAVVLVSQGKPIEAVKLLSDCLQVCKLDPSIRNDFQDDMENALTALDAETQRLVLLPRGEDGLIGTLKHNLSLMESLLGHSHVATLKVLRRLVSIYQGEDPNMAIQILSSSIVERSGKQTLSAAEEREILADNSTLAALYTSSGKAAQALPLLLKIAEKQQTMLGQNHPDLLATLYQIAAASFEIGDVKTAASKAEECVAMQVSSGRSNALDTLNTMVLQARALLRLDEHARAVKILESCLAHHEENVRTQNSAYCESHVDVLSLLADTYKNVNLNLTRVVPLRRRALWLSMHCQGRSDVEKILDALKRDFRVQESDLFQKASPILKAVDLVSADPEVSMSKITDLMENFVVLYTWDPAETCQGDVAKRAVFVLTKPEDSFFEAKSLELYKHIQSVTNLQPSQEIPFMGCLTRFGVLSAKCGHYQDAESVLLVLSSFQSGDVLSVDAILHLFKAQRALDKAKQASATGLKWIEEIHRRGRLYDDDTVHELPAVIRAATGTADSAELKKWQRTFLKCSATRPVPTSFFAVCMEFLPSICEDESVVASMFSRLLEMKCSDRDPLETKAELHYQEAMFWKARGNIDRMKQSLHAGNEALKKRQTGVSSICVGTLKSKAHTRRPTHTRGEPQSDNEVFGSPSFVSKLRAATADVSASRDMSSRLFTDGLAFFRKGDYSRAFESFSRAQMLQTEEHGPYHEVPARSHHYAACSLWKQEVKRGSHPGSDSRVAMKRSFERCLDVREAVLGSDHDDVLETRIQYALMLAELFTFNSSDRPRTIAMLQSLLDHLQRQRDSPGPFCGGVVFLAKLELREAILLKSLAEVLIKESRFGPQLQFMSQKLLSAWVAVGKRFLHPEHDVQGSAHSVEDPVIASSASAGDAGIDANPPTRLSLSSEITTDVGSALLDVHDDGRTKSALPSIPELDAPPSASVVADTLPPKEEISKHLHSALRMYFQSYFPAQDDFVLSAVHTWKALLKDKEINTAAQSLLSGHYWKSYLDVYRMLAPTSDCYYNALSSTAYYSETTFKFQCIKSIKELHACGKAGQEHYDYLVHACVRVGAYEDAVWAMCLYYSPEHRKNGQATLGPDCLPATNPKNCFSERLLLSGAIALFHLGHMELARVYIRDFVSFRHIDRSLHYIGLLYFMRIECAAVCENDDQDAAQWPKNLRLVQSLVMSLSFRQYDGYGAPFFLHRNVSASSVNDLREFLRRAANTALRTRLRSLLKPRTKPSTALGYRQQLEKSYEELLLWELTSCVASRSRRIVASSEYEHALRSTAWFCFQSRCQINDSSFSELCGFLSQKWLRFKDNTHLSDLHWLCEAYNSRQSSLITGKGFLSSSSSYDTWYCDLQSAWFAREQQRAQCFAMQSISSVYVNTRTCPAFPSKGTTLNRFLQNYKFFFSDEAWNLPSDSAMPVQLWENLEIRLLLEKFPCVFDKAICLSQKAQDPPSDNFHFLKSIYDVFREAFYNKLAITDPATLLRILFWFSKAIRDTSQEGLNLSNNILSNILGSRRFMKHVVSQRDFMEFSEDYNSRTLYEKYNSAVQKYVACHHVRDPLPSFHRKFTSMALEDLSKRNEEFAKDLKRGRDISASFISSRRSYSLWSWDFVALDLKLAMAYLHEDSSICSWTKGSALLWSVWRLAEDCFFSSEMLSNLTRALREFRLNICSLLQQKSEAATTPTQLYEILCVRLQLFGFFDVETLECWYEFGAFCLRSPFETTSSPWGNRFCLYVAVDVLRTYILALEEYTVLEEGRMKIEHQLQTEFRSDLGSHNTCSLSDWEAESIWPIVVMSGPVAATKIVRAKVQLARAQALRRMYHRAHDTLEECAAALPCSYQNKEDKELGAVVRKEIEEANVWIRESLVEHVQTILAQKMDSTYYCVFLAQCEKLVPHEKVILYRLRFLVGSHRYEAGRHHAALPLLEACVNSDISPDEVSPEQVPMGTLHWQYAVCLQMEMKLKEALEAFRSWEQKVSAGEWDAPKQTSKQEGLVKVRTLIEDLERALVGATTLSN
eukprot:Rmarinus@m.2762